MYLKRTVLLSNQMEENKILLIVEKSERVVARIKGAGKNDKLWCVFKFNNAPLSFFTLEKEGDEFSCELEGYTNVNENICAAVFSRPALECVFYGGTDKKEEFYLEFIKSFDEFVRQIDYQLKIESDKVKGSELFEESEDEIERQIDESLTNELVYECLSKCEEDKCKDCIYKKAFFERKNELLSCAVMEDKEEPEKVEQENTFFLSVEKSLNELFACYPRDEVLENKIEKSKFVKVDYENDGNFYSVGVIFDDDGKEKYICYALYGKSDCPPPSELSEFSQYLPIDEESGYYLMYQNACDGKNIVMENK